LRAWNAARPIADRQLPRACGVRAQACCSLVVPIRDVSELLGHSDVRLTLTSYANVLDAHGAKPRPDRSGL